MKTWYGWIFAVLVALVVAAGTLPAQTLHTLCSFNGTNGMQPQAALTLGRDGNFYGTTAYGGTNGGYGTVFMVTTNGTLTSLVSFNDGDGKNPYAGLTLGADGNFYGTTGEGGSGGWGTVFKVTTNGTLTTLVNFTNYEQPSAALTLGSDGNFYGTTVEGGINDSSYPYGCGTVFKMTTNGTLTNLVEFSDSNGKNPESALTFGTDGNLYGTTSAGGTNGGYGTVFMVTTNGTLTSLVEFNGSDVAYPIGLTLGNDGNFYGIAGGGSSENWGTVFKMTTNGTLTYIDAFDGNDGEYPYATLTLGVDGNLYGATGGGGSYSFGTTFQFTTNGALNTLISFANTNGANPESALTLGADGNFYGTTQEGGSNGDGTVFCLVVMPVITSQPQSLSVTNGHTASFVVAADGWPSLAYQWFFNGTNLNGATNTMLTLQNAFPENAGAYTVTVKESYGSITSNPAMLTVLPFDITAPKMLTNDQFELSFDTATGVNYAVQYSTNLTQWFSLVTLGGIGVPRTLIDTNAAGSQQRFYRIVLSPQ